MFPSPTFGYAKLEYLDVISQLESDHYPSDEGASRETIEYRLNDAPEVFWCAYMDRDLIGFVNGTRTKSDELTHDSMFSNDHDGCINLHLI
jgi:hypothetical protein